MALSRAGSVAMSGRSMGSMSHARRLPAAISAWIKSRGLDMIFHRKLFLLQSTGLASPEHDGKSQNTLNLIAKSSSVAECLLPSMGRWMNVTLSSFLFVNAGEGMQDDTYDS